MRPSGKLTVFGGISGCSKSRKSRLERRRCANIRRRSEAKHCSSLCSQSEGDEYCGGQARAENPTRSCAKALAIFATCSWPSLCKQSELQCWRRNRRLHLSLRRKTTDSLLVSERGTRYDRTWDETRPHAGRRSVVLRPAFAGKYREWSKKRYSAFVICRCEGLTYHLLIVYGSLSVDSCHQFIWC